MLSPEEINKFAEANGIHAIGWFSASDFHSYLRTIEDRQQYHKFEYRPLEKFRKAGHVPRGIKTIVVLAMDYFYEANRRSRGGRLSNYSRGCYSTLYPKTDAVVAFLRRKGSRCERLDLPYRAAACRAGLGFIGKNTLFYAYGLGSYVGLAVVGTDVEIGRSQSGEERITDGCCQNCNRCVEACPVSAISAEGYRIDPLRCLSFVNRHPDEPMRVLPANPRSLHGWLHGCETCQDVCPENGNLEHKPEARLYPELDLSGMVLPNKAFISREFLEARLNSIRSTGYREYVAKLLGLPDEQGAARYTCRD